LKRPSGKVVPPARKEMQIPGQSGNRQAAPGFRPCRESGDGTRRHPGWSGQENRCRIIRKSGSCPDTRRQPPAACSFRDYRSVSSLPATGASAAAPPSGRCGSVVFPDRGNTAHPSRQLCGRRCPSRPTLPPHHSAPALVHDRFPRGLNRLPGADPDHCQRLSTLHGERHHPAHLKPCQLRKRRRLPWKLHDGSNGPGIRGTA